MELDAREHHSSPAGWCEAGHVLRSTGQELQGLYHANRELDWPQGQLSQLPTLSGQLCCHLWARCFLGLQEGVLPRLLGAGGDKLLVLVPCQGSSCRGCAPSFPIRSDRQG